LAVQWLNETLCFVSSFIHTGFVFIGFREHFVVVVADSFTDCLLVFHGFREPFGVVLRNSQLLEAANCLRTSSNVFVFGYLP